MQALGLFDGLNNIAFCDKFAGENGIERLVSGDMEEPRMVLVFLKLERVDDTLFIIFQFIGSVIFLHHFGEGGADESGGNGKDSDTEHADDAGDDAPPEGDRRCFGKAARVAYVLRKRLNNRSPAVVVHLRLRLVLYEIEDEREHEGDDAEEL